MALERRLPASEIIEGNLRRIHRSESAPVAFPEVRALYGDVRMMASFSHPAPDPIGRELFGNMILFETASRAGMLGTLPIHRGSANAGHGHGPISIRSLHVINAAYDIGYPAHAKNLHPPEYHRIGIGDFPAILDAQRPYFIQNLSKRIIFNQNVIPVARKSFDGHEDAMSRLAEVAKALTPIEYPGKGVVVPAVPALLQARDNVLNLMEVDHISEVSIMPLMPQVASALRILEEKYNLPFYTLPLTPEFAEGGYLKAVDSDGRRRDVYIEMRRDNGNVYPVFSFTDSLTKQSTAIAGSEIYEWISDRRIVPTVPTLLLATVIGPQIPHMGGKDWSQYAPSALGVIGNWAGVPNKDVSRLFLGTRGYDPFKVTYTSGPYEGQVSTHFSATYVTLGKEAMVAALRTDDTLHGEYGKI